MKNIALLFSLILIFSSCDNFDDPILGGSVLETPVLTTKLVDGDKVQLTWSSNQICPGSCPPTVPATTYEIWTKSLTSTTTYKLAETLAGEMSFLVEELEPGVNQEFFVLAKRANVSNRSNRVMVVPNELPGVETIFEKDGFDYITHPQISPDGDKIAIANSDEEGGDSPQPVLLYDLQTKSDMLISENGQYPSWSASGEKLVFVSEDQNISEIKEYSVASGEVEEIVSDSFQSYFPVFGISDTTLIYFLDSLEDGDQSIISFNLDVEATNPKRSLRDVDDIGNEQMPFLGMSYSAEESNVAYSVTFPKETETGFSYDVVGFDLASPSATINLVVSDWNDSNPSFSSSDPDLLAFVSDRSGMSQVWIKNISTQQLVQVTDFQESEQINIGIVGLSWSGEKLYVNVLNSEGKTKLVSIDVSSLL